MRKSEPRRAIIGVLAAVVCGTLVAISMHISLLHTARAEAARLTRVSAVIIEPAALDQGRHAIGAWTTPDGVRRIGTVPAPVERGAGEHHAIWIDETGQLAKPPDGPLQRAAQTAVAGTAVAAAVILLTVRRPRQGDDIDAAWRRVAPGWKRHYL
jgi:hypothetical protein